MIVYYNWVVSTTVHDVQNLEIPLHMAAFEGRTDTVAYLLQTRQVDVNAMTKVCEYVRASLTQHQLHS